MKNTNLVSRQGGENSMTLAQVTCDSHPDFPRGTLIIQTSFNDRSYPEAYTVDAEWIDMLESWQPVPGAPTVRFSIGHFLTALREVIDKSLDKGILTDTEVSPYRTRFPDKT